MILFDTVAFINLATGKRLSSTALVSVARASDAGELLISAISFWEIDTLSRKTGITREIFEGGPANWLARTLDRVPAKVIAFEAEDALALTELPAMHADPADRMLVATARRRGIPLLTNDRKILALAGQGHVEAIAC